MASKVLMVSHWMRALLNAMLLQALFWSAIEGRCPAGDLFIASWDHSLARQVTRYTLWMPRLFACR